MSVPQWERLTCNCGSIRFRKVVHIKYHPTGGTSEEPAGFECAECEIGLVSIQFLVNKLELAKKKEDLKAKEKEIEESEAAQMKGVKNAANQKGREDQSGHDEAVRPR